MDGKDRPLRDF